MEQICTSLQGEHRQIRICGDRRGCQDSWWRAEALPPTWGLAGKQKQQKLTDGALCRGTWRWHHILASWVDVDLIKAHQLLIELPYKTMPRTRRHVLENIEAQRRWCFRTTFSARSVPKEACIQEWLCAAPRAPMVTQHRISVYYPLWCWSQAPSSHTEVIFWHIFPYGTSSAPSERRRCRSCVP